MYVSSYIQVYVTSSVFSFMQSPEQRHCCVVHTYFRYRNRFLRSIKEFTPTKKGKIVKNIYVFV